MEIESNSAKTQSKAWVPFLNTSVLAEVIKASRLKRKILNWPWFAQDLISHTEYPKDAAIKLLELINNFNKVENYKINIHDSETYLHSLLSEKQIRKKNPIYIYQNPYPGRNLTKEKEDPCSRNTKTLMRDID